MARHRLDPEGSRDAILKAARALFAERGLHGVSMCEIAELAGKSQGLIHHYFGSKEDLWRSVKAVFGEEFRGVVSPFLSEVVAVLLAKRPEERFPDAAALGRVLDEGEASSWWRARARARYCPR